MTPRTVEDRLREEYALLSPEIKRVLHQLRTDVTYLLLPVTLSLRHHERIQVEARVKECDSAIDSLRRRQEERVFDKKSPSKYSLTHLPDLVGARVFVFPRSLLDRVHTLVRTRYEDWTSDPVESGTPTKLLARKYHGFCATSVNIRAEIQIMSLLTGLFWRVEHGTLYKPRDAALKGASKKVAIGNRVNRVYAAFDGFENALQLELENDVGRSSDLAHP
jgi:ppGpp synthetase/RelA/SpoT-type nucleotidyltranferase